ncbi:MAG TPA: cyclic nucleotide-binding domain-containing protein, partial [Chloroflexi bacterium]|nr:cyclic nucleotide-binding domain-containing protein [Chloroflexota bacterium]
MSHKDILAQLKRVHFFEDLKRGELNAVVHLVNRRHFKEGEIVCEQGRLGHSMYVVESGELTVHHVDSQGVEHQVGVLNSGDYFGETSLLLGEPRDATVRAAQDTTLLHISRDDFQPLLDEQPSLLDHLN